MKALKKQFILYKKVGEDSTFIPLMDEKKVGYGGYNESNIFTEISFFMGLARVCLFWHLDVFGQ